MVDGDGPENARPYYYQLDHLGTPQELTSAQGGICWSARYKAYGNVARLDIEEIDNPLRFQGQYFDAETGLHYNRHRYYNPSTGRYLTADPIKLAGGLNSYRYVPNPTGWVDPLGLEDCPCSPGSGTQTPKTTDPAEAARVDQGSPNAPSPAGGKDPKFFTSETTWQAKGAGTGQTYKVFRQGIDWDLVVDGKSNYERAKKGGAPYVMKNGAPEQLHLRHSRQNGKGPLFELSHRTHLRVKRDKGGRAVHPYERKKHPENPVDRHSFEK